MSNSNIGGHKKKMSKDHLFVLYAVINSVKNGKEDPVQVSVYNLEKLSINCGPRKQ